MTKQNLEDIFITAFESGYSDYWMYIDTPGSSHKAARDSGLALSEYLWRNIWAGEVIDVQDAEDIDVKLGEINPHNIKRGVRLMKSLFEDQYDNALHGDYDAETADILMQLIVMGEVIYG